MSELARRAISSRMARTSEIGLAKLAELVKK
jgi:hypothetical protein